ncbi:MAG TPA: glycosyltransferase family 1 protein [Bacteroidales bacterium]|nr:glycosyltransferase family 1 protein [Bacteroidales bacterium]
MIKVLIIVNRFNLGGPTFNAGLLSKYLSDNFQTLLIGGKETSTEASSEYILNQINTSYSIIPEMSRNVNLANDYIAYKKIKSIIKDFKPDIVHTHAAKAGLLGKKAAIAMNVPAIIHTYHGHVFHSYFNKLTTSFYKGLERFYAKRTDKIITISNIQKQEICTALHIKDNNKFAIIPLGINLEKFQINSFEKRQEFRSSYHLDNKTIAIGIIGRLVPIKNHKLFINAFGQLKRITSKKIKAFIIGDGELYSELIIYASQLGLTISTHTAYNPNADIFFTSWIKEIDIIYAGLDIVALSSLNEGTPITLIEAQAAGKPIVSTNVGGVCDTVLQNKTALLSASRNVNDFLHNLSKLVANENLRLEFSANGKSFVNQRFHFQRMVNETENLYYDILSQKGLLISPVSRRKDYKYSKKLQPSY